MTDYNAGERAHVKQAGKSAKLAERQRQEFISSIMSTTPGRAWVYDLLVACHVFASSHTGNALNTAFAEGERNIGLRILSDIMAASPDNYVVMMREANGRDSAADSRRRQAALTVADRGDTGSVVTTEPDDGDEGDDAPDIYTEYERAAG